MNIELSKTRILICDESKSGLFYNNIAKEIQNAPDADKFSDAVKAWKRSNNVKSLRKYAARGGHLSSFYKNELIGNYLSRRKIKIDQWGVPIVPKSETSLYTGISEFSASALYSEADHGGQIISYRCSPPLDCAEEKALANAKKVNHLQAIDRFLLCGPNAMTSRHILEINSNSFNNFKINNQLLCTGVHYLPFSSLTDRYGAQNSIQSEMGKLIKSNILNGNNAPYFFIQKLINALELEQVVKFDKRDFNVVLHQFGAQKHGMVLAYIIDTKNPGKAKVTKLVGFNSWIREGLNDPLASLENNINQFRHSSDPLTIMKIYYGAQTIEQDPLNADGNCGLYSQNTMNALAKLLIKKESFYHKSFVQGMELEPTSKEKIDAGKKMILVNMIIYVLYLLLMLIFELFTQKLNLSTILFTSLLLTTVTAYYFNLFNISSWMNDDTLKTELQQALPQYFDEKNGQTFVKDFKERQIVHIQDRWLMGNIPIQGFMNDKVQTYEKSFRQLFDGSK